MKGELRERARKIVAPYAREYPGLPWAAVEADILRALNDLDIADASAPAAEGAATDDTFRRQWREMDCWAEWLKDYPPVSDDERHAEPRYAAVERWVYRLVSVGNCPGTIPVSAAIVHDMDALASHPRTTSDSEPEPDAAQGVLPLESHSP